MILLPIETVDHKKDAIFVVLDNKNLDRMKVGDPAEVELRRAGKTLINPTIVICYEELTPKFNRLIQSGNLKAIIKYLKRGWKFMPEAGDHDRGPESIHENN